MDVRTIKEIYDNMNVEERIAVDCLVGIAVDQAVQRVKNEVVQLILDKRLEDAADFLRS